MVRPRMDLRTTREKLQHPPTTRENAQPSEAATARVASSLRRTQGERAPRRPALGPTAPLLSPYRGGCPRVAQGAKPTRQPYDARTTKWGLQNAPRPPKRRTHRRQPHPPNPPTRPLTPPRQPMPPSPANQAPTGHTRTHRRPRAMPRRGGTRPTTSPIPPTTFPPHDDAPTTSHPSLLHALTRPRTASTTAADGSHPRRDEYARTGRATIFATPRPPPPPRCPRPSRALLAPSMRRRPRPQAPPLRSRRPSAATSGRRAPHATTRGTPQRARPRANPSTPSTPRRTSLLQDSPLASLRRASRLLHRALARRHPPTARATAEEQAAPRRADASLARPSRPSSPPTGRDADPISPSALPAMSQAPPSRHRPPPPPHHHHRHHRLRPSSAHPPATASTRGALPDRRTHRTSPSPTRCQRRAGHLLPRALQRDGRRGALARRRPPHAAHPRRSTSTRPSPPCCRGGPRH